MSKQKQKIEITCRMGTFFMTSVREARLNTCLRTFVDNTREQTSLGDNAPCPWDTLMRYAPEPRLIVPLEFPVTTFTPMPPLPALEAKPAIDRRVVHWPHGLFVDNKTLYVNACIELQR